MENTLHWVHDVTYDAGRRQIRTGNRPRVMASLRNLAITVLLAGVTTIAAALRRHTRRPHQPLKTLMTC